jgi:hypothetical protein
MASETIAYSQKDLRDIKKAFKLMDEEATTQVAIQSIALANYAAEEIKKAAGQRTKAGKVAQRVADGVSVSKSTKTQAARLGTFSYGFARQKFSGGADTQTLWGGVEFGSNKFKQFPTYSGRQGRGSRGWFIYPTLRRIQPELINKWEQSFDSIIKEWV